VAVGPVVGGVGTATVSGFQLAGGFDPISGWKAWDIAGQQAQANSGDATDTGIAITALKLQMYSGGGKLEPDTTIESPQATVWSANSTAGDPGSLYISGKSYFVTGNDWTWNGNTGNIDVRRDVLVTFAAEATSPANATATPATPITIHSDNLKIEQKLSNQFGRVSPDVDQKLIEHPNENLFVFSGNVTITDGNCTTTCGALNVLADRNAMAGAAPTPARGSTVAPPEALDVDRGRIESIVASDQVVTRQGDLKATGSEAEMFPGNNSVILSGSPEVRDTASGAVLQGSRIVWQRNSQEFDVEPFSITPGAPPRVRVSLPPLKHIQDDPSGAAAEPEADARPMIITGESLHAHLGETERRFDIERSVVVKDPQLTLDAQHLDAEFSNMAAPATTTASTATTAPATSASPVGQLTHLAASGDVIIYQLNRVTTADKAEISPPDGEITLSGSPQVLETLNNATITGNQIKLFTDLQRSTDTTRAEVWGVPGHLADVVLPSLPGLGEISKTQTKTHITSDSVTMLRDGNISNYTFTGNVHILASDLDTTCDLLEARSLNQVTPAGSGDDPVLGVGQVGEIVRLVASGNVVISQRDYHAKAASAEIYPQTKVADDSTDAPDATALRRSVELFGDPSGKQGPKRPTVVLPAQSLHDLGWDNPVAGAQSAPSQPIEITSDQQQLFTSPAGDIYWFKGNVTADGGDDFRATCDEMKVLASPEGNTTGANPPAAASSATIQKIIADGNVTITQKISDSTRVATADTAQIIPAAPGQSDGKVMLSGHAVVEDKATGSHTENSNIELHQGDRTAYMTGVPATPGKPATRPSFTLPAINVENLTKPVNKPSAGSSK
jgi:lipopolysaccharide export system protein LptA